MLLPLLIIPTSTLFLLGLTYTGNQPYLIQTYSPDMGSYRTSINHILKQLTLTSLLLTLTYGAYL